MSQRRKFGPLEQHVCFQIHRTWRAIRKLLLESGRNRKERISPGTWSMPILIGLNPGISPQELARALHLDASKVSLLLRPLEDEGIIERMRSDTDGRRIALRLTAKGESYAGEGLSRSEILEGPVAATITEAERDELLRILGKIRSAALAGRG